jgi:hypothetical protein
MAAAFESLAHVPWLVGLARGASLQVPFDKSISDVLLLLFGIWQELRALLLRINPPYHMLLWTN